MRKSLWWFVQRIDKDRRYQEAEVIAKQVQELKPDDPIAVSTIIPAGWERV